MKSDICRPRQQRFIKLLYTTALAKAGEKEKASVATAPFFFIVFDNHLSDICLSRFATTTRIWKDLGPATVHFGTR
jgi:hypothetical protein